MDLFMGGSRSNIDDEQSSLRVNDDQSGLRSLAIREFTIINKYLQAWRNRASSRRLAVATTKSEPNGRDQVPQVAVKEHVISGFTRRLNRNKLKLEDIWESVDIQRIDEIRRDGGYEWRPLYSGGPNAVKNAMVADENVILFRNIMDWSRAEGDVSSHQFLWSGNFETCERILQLLEQNNDTPNTLIIARESFDIHSELRGQYITRHNANPLLGAIAAVHSCKKVQISHDLVGIGDGESDRLLCAICHEGLSTEEPGKELRCRHAFHTRCIFRWFQRRLSCPICRYELK